MENECCGCRVQKVLKQGSNLIEWFLLTEGESSHQFVFILCISSHTLLFDASHS